MLRHVLTALACLLILAPPAAAQEAFRLGPVPDYAGPGHIIVLTPRAAPGTAEAAGEALAARHGASLQAVVPLPTLDETCYVLRLDGDADDAAVSREVMDEDGVLLAYPVQAFEIGEQAAGEGPGASPLADEPLLEIQDALHAMRVEAAHAHATGRGVRLALIDSGVAVGHPDLSRQRVETRDFVGTAGAASEVHGTAMATMIAADGGNGVGMVGVSPDIELLALRGCWEEDGAGRCNTFSLALALDHAFQAEADIVNLSLGGRPDRLLEALVGRLIDRGTLVVAASGEGAFPARVEGVLMVEDLEARMSGRAAVRAPGRDVLGAEPSGGYDFYTGASVAAAHASGVAALMWSSAAEPVADGIGAALAAAGDPLDACKALGLVSATPVCD